jgi:uncharacterized protein involved in exopolysaccharide biosynthesis
MKIGSFLLVLVLALVTLGYLVSDDLQVNRDLQNLKNQINQLTTERDNLQQELDQSGQTIKALHAQITDLDNQLAAAKTLTAESSAATTNESSTDKLFVTAGFLFLPSLAVGIPLSVKAFRNRKKYIRLSEEEIQQIIRQRRGHRV